MVIRLGVWELNLPWQSLVHMLASKLCVFSSQIPEHCLHWLSYWEQYSQFLHVFTPHFTGETLRSENAPLRQKTTKKYTVPLCMVPRGTLSTSSEHFPFRESAWTVWGFSRHCGTNRWIANATLDCNLLRVTCESLFVHRWGYSALRGTHLRREIARWYPLLNRYFPSLDDVWKWSFSFGGITPCLAYLGFSTRWIIQSLTR